MSDAAGLPFEWIVDHARMGVVVASPRRGADGTRTDFVVEYTNLRAQALFGLAVADLVGRRTSEVGLLQDDHLRALIVEAYEGNTTCSQTVRVDQGAGEGWYDVLIGRAGDRVIVAFDEITAEVETREREQLWQERMRTAFRRVPGAVFSFDRDLRITYLDDDAERMFGLDADSAVGRPLEEAYRELTDEHRDLLLRALEMQEPVEFDVRIRLPQEAWYRVRAFPDHDGITAFLTELAPLLRLEARAVQLERLEGLATLTGGIAHDFNNLIMVIAGHAALLGATLVDDHEGLEDVDAIVDAARRAGDLTTQLLSFSRQQVVEPVAVDLGTVVGERIVAWRDRAAPGVTVEGIVPEVAVRVQVDPTELRRVLDHLVDNAFAAMAGAGRLVVEVDAHGRDGSGLAGSPALGTGGFGVVTLTDDGDGMDAETLARATEPFFTTRSRAGSSGLGLSVAHGAALQAGGRLDLYSEPGVGTTVRLYLPEAPGDPGAGADAPGDVRADADVAARAVAPARDGERVLVVDDSASVRALVSRILTDLGYEVTAAADGNQALDRLREGPPVDAMVVDVVMPGMSGFELARAVEQERGPIPTLFVSGFVDAEAMAERSRADGAVLTKPFMPHELASRVRALLDGPG